MDGRGFIVQRLERGVPLPFLARTQAAEVLHRLRTVVSEQLKDDPTS